MVRRARRFPPWQPILSEFVGTFLLVGLGVGVVILDFGKGSPVLRLLPDPGLRRLVTGFIFGSVGGLIAVSPVGKASGAHINPVVTFAFRLEGKLSTGQALAYVSAQMLGAAAGGLALLPWGTVGSSIQYGGTFPGPGWTPWEAALGEAAATFGLIAGLFFFLGRKKLRRFTPLLFPFLYAVMVWLEAPLSGTSTNPARSFGPSLVSGDWRSWWVYWAGPVAGTLAALAVHRRHLLGRLEVEVAKLYHFEHDPHGIFRA
ncbi:MAG: aquaporin [Acidobacteriota bacterium]